MNDERHDEEVHDEDQEPVGRTYPVPASFGTRGLGWVIDFLPAFVIVGIPSKLAHIKPQVELPLFYIAWGIYGAVMTARCGGQTLGMRRMGIRCVDEATGQPPTGAQSAIRAFSATLMLSAALIRFFGLLGPVVDLLWANWDPKVQTLHDKMAKTIVVR